MVIIGIILILGIVSLPIAALIGTAVIAAAVEEAYGAGE